MPGLLRGVARTAVVAGTATAVSNGVSRRQYNKWEQKAQQEQPQQPQDAEPAPAPAPAPSAADDMDAKVEALTKLAALKDQGILSEEEFAAQKAKILG